MNPLKSAIRLTGTHLRALVPNQSTRIAVYDDGAGVAEKAAARAEAMGYENIHVLEGGALVNG